MHCQEHRKLKFKDVLKGHYSKIIQHIQEDYNATILCGVFLAAVHKYMNSAALYSAAVPGYRVLYPAAVPSYKVLYLAAVPDYRMLDPAAVPDYRMLYPAAVPESKGLDPVVFTWIQSVVSSSFTRI